MRYELTSLSKAYAENEWVNSTGPPWLEPTSEVIAAGKTVIFSYRIMLADSVRVCTSNCFWLFGQLEREH